MMSHWYFSEKKLNCSDDLNKYICRCEGLNVYAACLQWLSWRCFTADNMQSHQLKHLDFLRQFCVVSCGNYFRR